MDIELQLKKFRLYAVTDFKTADRPTPEKMESVCKGGADILQLRSKNLSDAALIRLGRVIRKMTRDTRTLFFVNDRLDLALALEADGIHLGQEDLPVSYARKVMRQTGKRLLLGLSTHSLEQAKDALKQDIDYFGLGPLFATPTKEHYPPVGLELIRQVNAIADKPFVCIGGINRHNLRQVLDAGARRVAMVRALFQSENPYDETRHIRDQIEKYSYVQI